ncbi:MAG: RNA pseudouridine synthase [Spirochaetaceae bacterium]|nr:RNA pseudouridine synthase [Spirochaetaceae bacterium]
METPEILYEDNHVLAVNKPTGMLVQGDKSGDVSILDMVKVFLKERDDKPGNVFLGLPHRLDRPTSGVLILAKTSKALSRLAASFRDRDVSKIYWALVEAPPENPEGELIDWLKKDGRTNTSRRVMVGTPGAKEAQLRYKLLGASERYWLIEVELLTGRHHQIRVQLSAMGCAIKGDLKYGAKRSNPGGGIHLHARRLETAHPTKDSRLVITAPTPDDPVWNAMENL